MYNANSNHVVVQIDSGEDIVIKDGIFIPNASAENSKLIKATITSVGAKCILGFQKGQRVLYDKYAINKINNEFGVLTEDNIILVEN